MEKGNSYKCNKLGLRGIFRKGKCKLADFASKKSSTPGENYEDWSRVNPRGKLMIQQVAILTPCLMGQGNWVKGILTENLGRDMPLDPKNLPLY